MLLAVGGGFDCDAGVNCKLWSSLYRAPSRVVLVWKSDGKVNAVRNFERAENLRWLGLMIAAIDPGWRRIRGMPDRRR